MQTSPKKAIRFTPKCYGWGFKPVSWQGVLCILILLGLVFASAYANEIIMNDQPNAKEIIAFIIDTFLLIFTSSRFMEKYSDGKLQWRWGKNPQ